MTSEGIALKREREAREFIDRLVEHGKLDGFLYGNDRNFKPWYSPRGLIDNLRGRVDRVLIGVNPGGSPREPDQTTVDRLWEVALNPSRPFNAYLDERWEGSRPGTSRLQRGVRNVFRVLYQDQWEAHLRNTACFNVCPVRTSDSSKIQTDLWLYSMEWCKSVLNDLTPRMIICNGNSDDDRSPWTVLKTAYNLDRIESEPLGDSNRSVKFGVASVEGTKVLAVPHLSRHGHWRTLPAAVDKFRDEFLSD